MEYILDNFGDKTTESTTNNCNDSDVDRLLIIDIAEIHYIFCLLSRNSILVTDTKNIKSKSKSYIY